MKAPTEVLSKPLEFKVKLAIGEDAYASLKTGRNLQKMVDALSVASTGTAIAKTGTVAISNHHQNYCNQSWLAVRFLSLRHN